jgi:filamentous hemagglutinin
MREDGRATDKAVSDAEKNLMMAEANLANATITFISSMASAAKAAGTSYGTGFYGSAGMMMDTLTHTSASDMSTAIASTIAAGGDISFNAGNNMLQIGSDVASMEGSVFYNIAKNLVFGASTDTYKTTEGTEHSNTAHSYGTNGYSGSANTDESKSSSSGTSYNYATTTARNGAIVYDVDGDMTAVGYNASAEDIALNVGGDFRLESLQNTSSSTNSSSNAGISGGSSGGGASYGESSGESERRWTDNQSSIIGTSSVDVNVEGKTTMVGSVIANIDEDGNDLGNLAFSTGSFEYQDLIDTDRNEQSGFNVSTNVGYKKVDNDGHPNGSTTIGMTDTGYEKEGITRATVGDGQFTARDDSDISGVNRDIARAQEVTKDMTTGALDGSFTIDNRLLTEEGRASIVEDFENLKKNSVIAGTGATGTILETVNSVIDVLTDDKLSVSEVVDTWKAYQSAKVYGITGGADEAVHALRDKQVNGEVLTPEELQLLSILNKGTNANSVYSNEGELGMDSDGRGGLVDGVSDRETKEGYINLANGAGTDGEKFFMTDAEEAAHNFTSNETLAKSAAGTELGYYNAVSWMLGYDGIASGGSEGVGLQTSWNNSYNAGNNDLLAGNTAKANTVALENRDYAVIKTRPLDNVILSFLYSRNSLDDSYNTEILHEQIFFEDAKGGDIGFFDDNTVRPDNPENLSKYDNGDGKHYDDTIMREAVKNVKPKQYQITPFNSSVCVQYNCQDFIDDVKFEYYKLLNQKRNSEK